MIVAQGGHVRIDATVRPNSAVWHHWGQDGKGRGILALGVWTERRDGHGEDAEPLLLHRWPSGKGLLAVFDGAGGAGAANVGRPYRGLERSNAWVASRAVRAATEEWFRATEERAVPRTADALRRHLAERLEPLRVPGRRKILGTMIADLPTTMAALDYRIERDRLAWQVLWAGDSRCYLLAVPAGLQQLSRDDAEFGDALRLLVDDPPMTNLIAADREFRVNTAAGEAPIPAVLVCATDGFFGWVRTPADFEYLLVHTLGTSACPAEWAEKLVSAVADQGDDDASLALLAVGYHTFATLRAGFAGRARYLAHAHWMPTLRAAETDRETFVTARTDSWHRYRNSYERRLPPESESDGAR